MSLDKISRDFRSSCVVTVTISETSDAEGYDQVKAHQINQALVEVGDRTVDWRALSHAQPGLLKPDGIHPTPDGSRVLAAAISKAVTYCNEPSP